MKQTEGLYRVTRLVLLLAGGAAALALALGIFTYVFFMRTVDLPEARAIAERELRTGTLRFGEQIQRAAYVYVRRPGDYFRGANGVLAATDERLLFIGVAPRGTLDTPDAPPVILQQEFVNDTLLEVNPRRVYMASARGVEVRRSGREARFGSTGTNWRALEELTEYVNSVQQTQRTAAARERRLREAVDRIVAMPLYYTVRRGDAISSLATWFGVSVSDLQEWNRLEGTRIRIGERLLVKPGAAAEAPARRPDAEVAAPG
jgi:plasmid stabilization system protein ParE